MIAFDDKQLPDLVFVIPKYNDFVFLRFFLLAFPLRWHFGCVVSIENSTYCSMFIQIGVFLPAV